MTSIGVFTSGIWQTTSTIIEREGACLVVDPAYFPRELDAIAARVHQLGRCVAVVFTHGHWDHVMGHAPFESPVWLSDTLERSIASGDARAAKYLDDAREFDSRWYVPRPSGHQWPSRRRGLRDNETIDLEGAQVRVLHLPGHSPDGLGLVVDGTLLVGDYLSPCEIPFVDDLDTYRATLSRLLELLPETREVIPGHGPRLDARRAAMIAREDLAYLERLATAAKDGDRAAALAIPLPRATDVVGMADHHRENCTKVGYDLDVYRDDLAAARARLEALIGRQRGTVERVREQITAIVELRTRLVARDVPAGDVPEVDPATSEPDVAKLDLAGVIAATDEAEARADALDRQLEGVSKTRALLERRIRGEAEPLTPPPRWVPIRYVLAEATSGVFTLMVFATFIIPLIGLSLVSPTASAITAGGLVVLAVLLSVRSLRMLRWGVELEVEVVGVTVIPPDPTKLNDDPPATATETTDLVVTLVDGHRRRMHLDGNHRHARYFGDSRDPERIVSADKLAITPRADQYGRWTGHIGFWRYIQITIVVAYVALLVVFAALGVSLK